MGTEAAPLLRTPLYASLAERMLSLIEQGTYREGDRLPSLRSLSQTFEVSVNTIKEAYQLLETQRFLEARPQSGYYVRRRVPALPRPEREKAALDPLEVSMCDLYNRLLEDRRTSGAASLAIALPHVSLLPQKRLQEAFSTVCRTFGQNALAYCFSPGLKSLREHIARQSLEAGISVSPDEVIITAGASEALFLALTVVARPGDTIAVETPTYFNFLSLLKELGYQAIEIPATPGQGIQLDVLNWVLERHAVKAVLSIPNFNNPLGFCATDDHKRALVELTDKHGVPLIEDDIYGELAFSGRRPLACKSFDTGGNVILVSSFSKTLAPGFRVGWILPGRHYAAVDRLKSVMGAWTSTPAQMAIARYLDEGGYDRHLRHLRKVLADQMGRMAEVVIESFPAGTKITRPAGGFVLWVELPEGNDTIELFERAVRRGLSFSPGQVFSASGKFTNCLRLNAGVWSPEIESAVRQLGELAGAKGV